MHRIPLKLIENARRIPFEDNMIRAIDSGIKTVTRRPVKINKNGEPAKCMYGAPGDLMLITGSHILVDKDGELIEENKEDRHHAIYRVDYDGTPEVEGWRPPMFMPKWAPTRIVRCVERSVENLCEIDGADAMAEGIKRYPENDGSAVFHWDEEALRKGEIFTGAVEAYVALWNEIHEERGLLFSTNPLVWRFEFEVVDPESLVL